MLFLQLGQLRDQALVQRMLTATARVDSHRVRQGTLRDSDFTQLARAAGILPIGYVGTVAAYADRLRSLLRARALRVTLRLVPQPHRVEQRLRVLEVERQELLFEEPERGAFGNAGDVERTHRQRPHRSLDVVFRVFDDGVGFRVDDPRKPQSLGVVGLRERARLLRGSISLASEPGKGTRVEARIPLETGA